MDSGQKALIQASFRRVLTVADLATELFAGRLYLLDALLWQELGLGSRAGQRALLARLAQIVDDLDRFEQLATSLEALARRCAVEGIEDLELDTVAETLIWTLQQVLGDAFNARTAAAWRAGCAALVGRMKHAADAQTVSPATLRRIRRSSCPELWQGPFRPVAVPVTVLTEARPAAFHPVHEEAEIDLGRFADLPPPPPSGRAPSSARAGMPISSSFTST